MCKELINFKSLLDSYSKELLDFEIFSQETAHGRKCWTELNNRVIEHVSAIVAIKLKTFFIKSFCRTFESSLTIIPELQ